MIDREHEFAGRILSLIPINNLDARLQAQAMQAGELFEYKKKKVIFEADSRDAYTYYLVDGDLALESADASPLLVSAGSDQAQRALAQLQPRRYTARSTSAVTMYRIERAILDQLLTEEQLLVEEPTTVEVSELDDEDGDDNDWMTRLLSSELFTRLPHENIQKFFAELEPLPAVTGEVIVEQGRQGEYLYIVAEGQCAVSRIAPRSDQELHLATLKEGDAFGEESLISNSPCNASVKMISPGFLMRLSKRSFEELVSKATLKPLTWSEANQHIDDGAHWLDVRFKDEHDLNAIDHSLNLPLNALRLETAKLDKEVSYIVYCDTGARSSTGAFLLARLGFDTYYLAGGLDRSPLGQEAGLATDISQARAVAKEPSAKAPIEQADEVPESAPVTPAPKADGPSPATVDNPLTTLRAERDKAAALVRKGAETVKELKARYEELRQAAIAERGRRETLERELADAQAASQRQLEMEQSRFNSELERVRKKLEDTGQTTTDLEQQLQHSREELQQAQQHNQQQEEARISCEVATEDALATVREQIITAQSRAQQAEANLESLRAEIAEQLTSTRETLRSKEAETSQLEQAVAAAESHLEEQKLQLETQRTQFETELQAAQTQRNETEAGLRSEKTRLDAEAAIQEKRAAVVKQREIDLQDRITAWEVEVTKREEALHRQELELSEERTSWQSQIDTAIASERDRLEQSVAAQQQAKGLMDAQAAETLAEQRCEALRNEFAALAVATKVEFESQLAAAQSAVEPQQSEIRAHYEARLAEREALHEDEHRHLEAENLHLRDALSEAQKMIKNQKAESKPAVAVMEIDLTIADEVAPQAPAVKAPEPAPLPIIEIGDEPMVPSENVKERIVGAEQLAEIRKKMQDKLAALRK